MLTVSLESFLFLTMRTLRSVFSLALPIPSMPSYFSIVASSRNLWLPWFWTVQQ
jgi:hypothetical protein